MTKKDIIKNAIKQRQEELLIYDINIINYEMLLEQIDALPPSDQQTEEAMTQYREEIAGRLRVEKIERLKTHLILSVLEKQWEN